VELLIMRHAETAWTISGQHTSTTDLPLTPEGEQQAAQLGQLVSQVLGGRRLAAFVSSPRQRALRTAQLALPDETPVVEPLLSEYEYGRYEGLTTPEIRALVPGWDIWRDGCPEGESTADVGKRADSFLEQYVEPASGPVLAVTHGHFSRVLAACALGLAPEQGRLLSSSTGSVSVIKPYDGRPTLALWNATLPSPRRSSRR
jgi:probable phosphoglycerate mutase